MVEHVSGKAQLCDSGAALHTTQVGAPHCALSLCAMIRLVWYQPPPTRRCFRVLGPDHTATAAIKISHTRSKTPSVHDASLRRTTISRAVKTAARAITISVLRVDAVIQRGSRPHTMFAADIAGHLRDGAGGRRHPSLLPTCIRTIGMASERGNADIPMPSLWRDWHRSLCGGACCWCGAEARRSPMCELRRGVERVVLRC